MTPDEAIETLREAIGPRDLTHLGPTSGWAQHAETLHRERHEALDRMASLARDHADLLDWAERAAEGIERAEYWAGKIVVPTERSPQREEWRALLSEWDAMKERP